MKHKFILRSLGVTILLVAFMIAARGQDKPGTLTPEQAYASSMLVESLTGKAAPKFVARSLTNAPVSLSNLRGKVVLLSIWTTSCMSCIEEMKVFSSLKSRFAKQRVTFLALDPIDSRAEISRFLKSHSLPFKVLYAPNPQFIADYSATAYPTTYIIDKTGIIRYSESGYDKRNSTWIVSSTLRKIL